MRQEIANSDESGISRFIELRSQWLFSIFGICFSLFIAATIITSIHVMARKTAIICSGASMYLLLYSALLLILTRQRRIYPWIKYVTIVPSIILLTTVKLSFLYGKYGYANVLKDTLTYDLYFIFIILSALYHNKKFTMITGVTAACCYGILIAMGHLAFGLKLTMSVDAFYSPDHIRINIEVMKALLLVLAAFSTNIITSNLMRLLGKVQESEREAHNQIIKKTDLIDHISTQSDELLDVSKAQSDLEKSLGDCSRKQLDFTGKLAAYIDDLYHFAKDVSEEISNQSRMSVSIKNHVKNLREWHDNASILSKSFNELSTEIANFSNEATQDIKKSIEIINVLSMDTEEIQDFIAVINDITDRINLLSLNAAIEAARAGEAGKGFAVVADEISKLADATSEQSTEISKRLSKNVADVSASSEYIQQVSHSYSNIVNRLGLAQDKIMQVFDVIDKLNVISLDLDASAATLYEKSGTISQSTQEQAKITGLIKEQMAVLTDNSNLMSEWCLSLTELSEKICSLSSQIMKTVVIQD